MKEQETTTAATLVLGATPNPTRYAYLATERLLKHGHEVVLVGIKEGEIAGIPIINNLDEPATPIDTVTLYVGPQRQSPYYDYLLELKPRRIIFNPGTENPELMKLAKENDIEPVIACTLVLLATGVY